MNKKNIFLNGGKLIAAALLLGSSLTANAQDTYVPKHEFGVNLFGGISSLTTSVKDADTKMGLGGGFGFSYIYHFNDQWGLLTGIQGAYYQNKITADEWWTNSLSQNGYGDVRANSFVFCDFEEKQSAMHLQIPIMVQNLIPMGKNHFYWAAGVKLGIKLTDKYKQTGEIAEAGGQFTAYEWKGPNAPQRGTRSSMIVGDDRLFDRVNQTPDHVLGEGFNGIVDIDPTDKLKTDEKLDMKAFNLMLSAEAGFRWALSDKMGLYTGLYLDYGVLNCRPDLAIDKYGSVENGNGTLESVPFLPNLTFGDREWQAQPMSIVQAQQSDRFTAVPSDVNADLLDPAIERRNADLAKRLGTFGFGLNLRLTFGTAPAVAEPPVIIKPIAPDPPVVLPPDITAKMRELSNTLFAFDKFDLNDKAKGYLDEIADWLNENPNLNVEIAGHTDSKGTDEYNQKLSENRAKSVYEYFISKGVKANRLSYKGYGESMPIATNDTDEGRQLNRRVELKIVK